MKNILDMVEYLGQKDNTQRFQNLCSLINVDYEIQERNGIKNIIVPSKTNDNKITISAHWDVFPGSNGYNDNASGMSVLLNVQNDLPDNVEMIFTDREERGGMGSNLYLKRNQNKPVLNINIDVVGFGSTLYYEYYGTPSPINLMLESAELYPEVPFNDSHVFNSHGVNSILFISGDYSETLISDIWKRQHCGKYDNDITQVDPTSIQKMIDQLLKIFNNL